MKPGIGQRLLSLVLVLTSVPLPSATWWAAPALASDHCADWGGRPGTFGSTGDCLAQARDDSQRRGDQSRRAGEADRQRAQDAGQVAQRLDQDKGDANQQYQNPALSPAQKGQFEQTAYRLPQSYSEKYKSLSEFRRETTGASLPPEPGTNRQLMNYNTDPLKELQREQEEQARREFDDAQKALAAAQKFENMGKIVSERKLGMKSLEVGSGAVLPSRRKSGPWGPGEDPNALAEAGQGLLGGNKIHRPGSENGKSDITRSSGITVSPAGRALGVPTGDPSVAAKKPEEKSAASAAADALKRMEAAKQLLSQREKELAELERPRNGAESVIQDLQRTQSGAPAGGRSPASLASAREDEALDGFRQPGLHFSAATSQDKASWAGTASQSLFEQVSRQYHKRMQELARVP